jgi:hypothetical protein
VTALPYDTQPALLALGELEGDDMTAEPTGTGTDLTRIEPQPDPGSPGRAVLRIELKRLVIVEYRGPSRRAGILGTVALTIGGVLLAPANTALWILGFGTLVAAMMMAPWRRRS